MIGAIGDGRSERTIVEAWANADGYARISVDRNHPADKRLRAKCTIAMVKSGAKIGDLNGARIRPQDRFQDRRIIHIALFRANEIFYFDRKYAVFGSLGRGSKQAMKNGVSVEARQAKPNNARLSIDKRADAAISNQS